MKYNLSRLFELSPKDLFFAFMLLVVSRVSEHVPEQYLDDVTLMIGGAFYLAYEAWNHFVCKDSHVEEDTESSPQQEPEEEDDSWEGWLEDMKG